MTAYTPLSSDRFQDLSTRLTHLGTHLLHYVQEQRSGQEQEGIDPGSLIDLEQEIEKCLNALEHQTYEVAVIAAMKAGKSTFLNAVIGADVLASESEACTVCRTEIRHVNPGVTPYLLEYPAVGQEPTLIAEGEAEQIRQAFLDRTHGIRKANAVEDVESFVLHHPIAAIQDLKVLSGFTLIDTPGPNEWETQDFNTVSLKQVALEVMRNCKVILFVLDYTSFKDNTNKELLTELIEKRRGFLEQDRDKLYFLLNKVDRKAENDRPLAEVVAELKATLQGFGIPDPKVYISSARQGLLARLILQGQAKEEHIKDFKKFFSAQYAQENEEGDMVIPGPQKIAPQALIDSGIPQIEESIIATIAQNAGIALLSEVLGQFDGVAGELEGLIQVSIQGWSRSVEDLERKLEEYIAGADRAKARVDEIKKKLVEQQTTLTEKFNAEVDQFAKKATQQICHEIDALVDRLSKGKKSPLRFLSNLISYFSSGKFSGSVVEFSSKEKAKKAYQKINETCTPIIQNFWLETQDKLVRDGNGIRKTLARTIEQEMQVLADEIAEILGEILKFEFKSSKIQIPDFTFEGIDEKIKKLYTTESSTKVEKRKKKRSCKSPKTYYVKVPYERDVSYYTIDFEKVKQLFTMTIDHQKKRIQGRIHDLIVEQVSTDLDQANYQFVAAFQRVQRKIEQDIQQHHNQSGEISQVIAALEAQLAIVKEYQQEIERIQQEINGSMSL